jgi:hypothetical protein
VCHHSHTTRNPHGLIDRHFKRTGGAGLQQQLSLSIHRIDITYKSQKNQKTNSTQHQHQ